MSDKTESVFAATDPTAVLSRVFSLKDVRALAYRREGAGQEIEIEQAAGEQRCPRRGARAGGKDRPRVRYADLPVYGRAMSLLWRRHRWRCPQRGLPREHVDRTRQAGSLRQLQAGDQGGQMGDRAGGTGRTVSEVAAWIGRAWHTVNDAVATYGSAAC